MAVFWGVASCSLAGNYRRFRSSYCLHHQNRHHRDDTISTSETSINFQQITRRNMPDDSFHIRRRQNLNLTYMLQLYKYDETTACTAYTFGAEVFLLE
jgi:hypothetical protein